jgi:hypothetical protein
LSGDLLDELALQYSLMMETKKAGKTLEHYCDLKQQVALKDFIHCSHHECFILYLPM